jgi:ribosome-binding factor A
MNSSNLREIKREKKKSLFFREISQLVQMISESEPSVARVYVTKVDFTDDFSICYAYLSTYAVFSEVIFDEALVKLKLYKPSIRKELASRINPRYTPDVIFLYDKAKEKQSRIDTLLDKVRDDLHSEE